MELVGGHCQIVDELESRFEVICDPTVERTVQVVVLRGVSGSGKSRIIREFYRRLRARRQDSYWPELPESSADDPLVYRKVVAPPLESMVWAADALPSFCWWGFRCDRRAEPEVSSHLLEDIQAQFRVHGLPLTMARPRVRSVGQAAAEQWQGLVQHVRALVRDEVSDQALSALSGLVGEVPGLGLLSRSLFRVGSVARQRWVERRRLHEEELLGDDYLASLSVSSRDLARNLLALALPGLPAVVAVEDGHWLDQSFADFLEVLAERQARRPVMVIVTDWPEGYSAPVYRPWLDRLVAARRATVLQVPDLSVDDRARLVGQVVPGAGGGLALKAARRAANPLLLLGWLAQDSVRRRLAGAAPEVEDELVGSMPAQLADMYRERWQALPATVQADLVVAVASSSDEDALARFIPPVVADASQRVLGLDQSRMTQSLDEAVQAAWCLRSEHLEWLREEPMAALLRQPGVWQPVLTAPEREELRAEVAQAAARYLERHPVVDAIEQSPEQRLAARLSADIVNFDTAPDAYAAQAILSRYLTARQWARGYDYRRAVALMQPVAKRLSTLTDPGSLHIRHQVAYWTGETGDPHTALKLATALLPDRERVLGPTHPETLRTRHNIASWTAETGDPHTALKLATALLPD
ncbi:MAG: tetratricopeptide repeat protein, partial [Propionibacteriaceae bacterium]|nr:tetratricopeptide repeat protein [Propionibacteriaceae bacterium]